MTTVSAVSVVGYLYKARFNNVLDEHGVKSGGIRLVCGIATSCPFLFLWGGSFMKRRA